MNEETTVEVTNDDMSITTAPVEPPVEEAHEDPVEAEEAVEVEVEVEVEVCKCWPSVKQNGLCPH